jgi:hypothetical protein
MGVYITGVHPMGVCTPHRRTPHGRVLYGRVLFSSKMALRETSRSLIIGGPFVEIRVVKYELRR